VAREPLLRLLPTEEQLLGEWAEGSGGSPRRALRARIILELARSESCREIADRLEVHPETVARWRRRFQANRTEGLLRDAPRVRPPGRVSAAVIERIVRATRDQSPPGGGRWTTRSLAGTLRVNHMLVHRVWRTEGLRDDGREGPHPSHRRSPVAEAVGVFFDAPAVVVFAIGSPDLAPTERRPAPRDDRKANGLLTALDHVHDAVGPVPRPERRTPHELLVFLRSVEERYEGRSEFHVFFDRTPAGSGSTVDAWFEGHRHFHAHYPYPGESWTGMIDRWLREVPLRWPAEDRIRVSVPFSESIARASEGLSAADDT
jgi:transposase